MKRLYFTFLVAVLFSVLTFGQENNGRTDLITKKNMKLNSNIMTPEVLWSFGRIGESVVSPDKTTVLFGVTYYDIQQNKGNCDLYTVGVDGKNLKQITSTPGSEYNATWRPDGKKIGFLSAQSGEMQLYEINPDGTDAKQISFINGGIDGFKYSPDMSKILYIQEVKVDKNTQDIYPDLPKASGRIMDDLMYRHWDQFVDTYTHIFVADYNENKITEGTDIMPGEPWESPLKPFGGLEQINFSPDSKTIAYTCRKLKGKEYALSTNSDIYLYAIATKKTTNLTEGMMGYDISPVYSPDGSKIAWESMEHNGYESDKSRLFVHDFTTGTKTDYSRDFDQNSNGLTWSDDGKSIYFISDIHATDEIYRLDLKNGKITRITDGIHNYLNVAVAGKMLIAQRQSMSSPTEIYAVNPKDGKETQITFVNKDLLDQLKFGNVEKRWIKTTDNKEMLTWIIYPPNFDPNKKYPTLLYCEGGPQSTVSQFWSYRWNFQMMAANDYIIVAPNRRGLPGFGTAWNEQISGDYGGQNMQDYLSAIDSMKKESFVNADKLGCVGASYGGFSVYWLAGNHNKRFKAFIAHDGMFNLESQYTETEEMWFVNWDLGGPFWDKDNATAQRSYANSPHKFVQNWDTPILVIHGERDYRIPATQGMSAFDAAVLRGVPAKMLYFPDENHWVLKPQNGILWQRTFFGWLDKWLK
ncbi:MAG TPA: S9 family peptidase [Bacteroidales bacterium]|nr:S9 family peptidase [Bacteroidales bacterium]